MLKTTYSQLNKIQKGSFGEAYAKMAFTLEGFEVYNTEYDDRGIDFVVRNRKGQFFCVQVKTTDTSANPFIYETRFSKTDNFLFCAIRLIEGAPPDIYLARGSDWNSGMPCLNYNPQGGKSGPYYEIRFAATYANQLAQFQFDRYVETIKDAHR